MIEYNPDLYTFIFEALEISGRDNQQQQSLNKYYLADNLNVIIHLFAALYYALVKDDKKTKIIG